MEKARFFSTAPPLNWQSGDHQLQPALAPTPEMTSLLGGNSVHNLNWDQPTNHNILFQSALSSLVSSPSSNPPATTANDSVAIHELICRLGSICNSDETPLASCYRSANTSCYSTPLNSPPKLNLSTMELHQQNRGGLPASGMSTVHLAPLAADPGFAERAVRLSCFGGRSYGSLTGQFRLPETGKLTRVSSSHSLMGSGSPIGVSENGKEIAMLEGAQAEMEMRSKLGSRMSASSTQDNVEFGSGQEESSASERITAGGEGSLRGNNENNARKRKVASKGKVKEAPLSSSGTNPPKTAEEDASNSKRSKLAETNGTDKDAAVKPKAEQNGGASGDAGQKQGKENNAKPPDPPKDYIHVRARRGQATDSHSLAERVRREKISERMKFLQDLVPGCNKVTGKAVMLDEIINYVQSLQRQVEFLSMKLATVNPRLDFNMESLLMKDMHQSRGPSLTPVYQPLEAMSTSFQYPHQPQGTPLPSVGTNGLENQCSLNPLDSSLRRSLNMQLPPLDGFGDGPSQLGTLWEDDLHSVVQMGFGQSQESAFSSQGFHGTIPTNHMKIEL